MGNCFVSPKRNKGNILSVTEQELKVRKLNIKNDEKYNNWIVDGPKGSIINYKAYKIISYIIPVILSLIFYLLFLLIRLQKQDKQI